MAMTDWTALLQKNKICFEHTNFLNSAVQKATGMQWKIFIQTLRV